MPEISKCFHCSSNTLQIPIPSTSLNKKKLCVVGGEVEVGEQMLEANSLLVNTEDRG